jgi:hypothetical protein
MTLIEQDHTQTLAEAGAGWPARKGLRLGLRGRLDEAQLDLAEPLLIVVNRGEGDVDPLLHGGITAPRCPPSRCAW